MVQQVVSTILYRVLLPLALLTAVAFRFNVFSFVYLVLLLLNPFLRGPSPESMRRGHPKRYLIATLSVSIIFCLAHVIFQAVLLGTDTYKTFDYCTWRGRVFAVVGFHTMNEVRPFDAIRLIGLDFLVLFTSFGVFIACSKLEVPPATIEGQEGAEQSETSRVVRRKKRKTSELVHWIGEILILVFLAGSGILHPSLPSAVYFLTFISVCTWFACNQKLGRKYLLSKVPLSVFSGLHFVTLYIYQVDYIQLILPPKGLAARLLGLTNFIDRKCESARTLVFHELYWTLYVSPLFILSLYWLLALIIRREIISPMKEEYRKEDPPVSRVDSKQSSHLSGGSLRHRRQSRRHTNRTTQDDRTRLLDDDRTARTYQATTTGIDNKEGLAVDPNGSVIWTSESDMPDKTPDEIDTTTTGGVVTKLKKVSSPIVTALKLIAKGSYVATLIIMMTWSITYHSWLTFVLLLWSCILWMCPNSRQACLRSSPALVAYAEALLLLQYILGLDVGDAIIPQFSKNVVQIGLVKYGDLTYQPLAIKILYTMMFWITLRQFVEEKQELNRRDISEGVMMEPFNISYCTAQPGFPRPSIRRHFSIVPSVTSPNPYIRIIAETVYSLLVKYWIWVVAIMLMIISLGGDRVVIYRIVYMLLFLFFILMFQFSYQLWRKVIYGFWLTVIIFSMLVLILIYTYQFEDFDMYWERYLGVSKDLQRDLGLELYKTDTGSLFVQLLTPTFFLIITIIQLHYFHREFLMISDIHYKSHECIADRTTLLTVASVGAHDENDQTHIIIDRENEHAHENNEIRSMSPIKAGNEGGVDVVSDPQTPVTPVTQKEDVDSTRAERELEAVKDCLETAFQKFSVIFSYVSAFLWRFLEIHIFKIIMFSVLLLAAYNVCAIHVLYVFLLVMALPLKSLQTFFSHFCSVWTACLLLSKMIYRLNIADMFNQSFNCSTVLNVNSSELPPPFDEPIYINVWIGYSSTDSLADYCKGYIGLILVLTIQAVVKIRQKVHRLQLNEPEPKPGVLFPDATRATADDNILECLKFLANYIFYKFGLEICFITTVICIGVRLDAFAMISAAWLCILFLLRRKTIAKIWAFYVAYQCIVLPIQYLMCIGLPPTVCYSYPWNHMVESLREWLFLPDYVNPPSAHKIIVDFFQLIFACCQLFVFRIETGPIAEMYEGGSNKEIFYEGDSNVLRCNPIPDFITYTKSSLDMLKAIIFVSFFWITLAVVFEAGTSRVNLFAMGYVIGCFYFLWNGNEFYLKPRKVLLKVWNVLLAYNVVIILIKTVLQLIGCVYIEDMKEKCCVVVQLFGIGCLKKLSSPTDTCKYDDNDAGIIVDGICFAFLLLQKRLFSSYYFQHLVNEIKAQQVLSSRGAELIHEIQMKDVQEQQAIEKEIMEKIKKKMDRIRAYQQKIRGGENMEPKTHFQAIRSGDYYMFDEYSDEDIDLDLSARHKKNGEDDDEDSAEVKEKGLNAIICRAIRHNLKVVDEPRKESGELDDVGDSSQQSAIVSADRYALPGTSSEKTSYKSPDPLTISSSGPTMTLSLPSPEPTTSTSRPEEATLTPQDVKIEEKEEIKETFVEKMKRWWDFVCEFLNSVLISTTAKLNAVSRDYRFVARKLSIEKRVLKEKFIRNGSFDMSEAEVDMKSRDPNVLPGSSKDLNKISNSGTKCTYDFLESIDFKTTPDKLDQEFQKNQPVFTKFLAACYYAAISRSELLCYGVIVINQMKTASILSLPLPLFVFLWATLSVPRPSKAFWITIITYTEAIVVLKYLFQFYFFPWNSKLPPPNDPFYLPVIFGVMRDDNYAFYDLLVLLVVFFHRIMLKSLGLWKDTDRNLNLPYNTSSVKDFSEKDEESSLKSPNIPAITKDMTSSDDELSDIHEENSDDDGSETVFEELQAQLNVEKCMNKVVEPVKLFFCRLLFPKYRVTVDVYAFMFFCDFINFFIVVFGYWAFGTGGTEAVTAYFEENKVPIPFLIMLVAQFALIVTDRALYLRKYILGKLIFQIILVFVVHMWMFFILPAITLREFNSPNNIPPKMWYLIKCVYLLLSAYQIRSGYPTRILGNFFCKKYNYANLFLFRGYMVIPFLYELRSLMDWIWTDTSMNISNWLKMEDIYANIFVLKCTRRAEDAYPTPRGAKRTALIKYGVGGSLLLLIILIIWFPLLLFALGNTVGQSIVPVSCTVELGISGFEPFFRMTALKYQIKPFTFRQWNRLQTEVTKLAEPSASTFLTSYSKDDTVIIELSQNSTSVWEISPPSRASLVEELRGNSELKMMLSWSFLRDRTKTGVDPEVRDRKELNLTDQRQLRDDLASMIDTDRNASVPGALTAKLVNIFPNYVKVPGKGDASIVTQLYPKFNTGLKPNPYFGTSYYRNISVAMWLLHPNDTLGTKWWEVQDDCSSPLYKLLEINTCDYLRLVAFNDKAFPSELSILSGYGIVGLYTTFVFVVSRLVRGFVAGSSFVIMFDDMPYVDRVLQLCLDIYLVRESNEFTLEEDLFAKLIFLYRSPEMLIKWTRPPELEGDAPEAQLPALQQ